LASLPDLSQNLTYTVSDKRGRLKKRISPRGSKKNDFDGKSRHRGTTREQLFGTAHRASKTAQRQEWSSLFGRKKRLTTNRAHQDHYSEGRIDLGKSVGGQKKALALKRSLRQPAGNAPSAGLFLPGPEAGSGGPRKNQRRRLAKTP